MLILPKNQQLEAHQAALSGLKETFNDQMERILNANGNKEKYWILGRVKFPEEFGGFVGRTFLEATDSKPPLVKNAFLYEVDNSKGSKTLLWVLHPDGSLRLPTLGKTLKVSPTDKKRAKSSVIV